MTDPSEVRPTLEELFEELEGMLPRLREAEYPYTEKQHRRRYAPFKVPIMLSLAGVEYLLSALRAADQRGKALTVEKCGRWIVVASSEDIGSQSWCIGIEGKGPREWFDTRADAERAVALLNRATMPDGSLVPLDVERVRLVMEDWFAYQGFDTSPHVLGELVENITATIVATFGASSESPRDTGK